MGIIKGFQQGRQQAKREAIIRAISRGATPNELTQRFSIDEEAARQLCEAYANKCKDANVEKGGRDR